MKHTRFLQLLAEKDVMPEGYFCACYSDLPSIADWPAYTKEVCLAELENPDSHFLEEAKELADSLGYERDELSLENCEVVSFSEEHITLNGGGDWQAPVELTIREVDDKLRVVEAKYFQLFCSSPADTEPLEKTLEEINKQ